MEWYVSAIILFSALMLLLFSGLHVGAAFASVGILGFFFLERGLPSLAQSVRIMHDSLFSYGLLAIPLFILMAELLEAGGATRRLYTAVSRWFWWLPGSLPTTSMITCGIFGAACGSSLAATASLGKIMFAQMLPRGVDKELSAGTICAGGSLSLLVPPSLALILFGALTQASVGTLFIAALVPGAIQVVLFCIYIMLRVLKNPALAPSPSEARMPWRQLLKQSGGAIALVIVIVGVLGSIYAGVATASEAGAVGAFLAIPIGLGTRELGWPGFTRSLLNTLRATGFTMFLLLGGQVFTRLISLQGIAHSMSSSIVESGLSPFVVLFFVTIMYLFLGMLMDGISITVLTVPILTPILVMLGFNIIWIGIYVTILINIGLLTPPVGLNAYIVRGIGSSYGIELSDVFRGSLPFVFVMALSLVLIIIYPELVLWLPATMR